MATKALFSPIKIGLIELKHRIVLAPLTRNRASIEAIPSNLQLEYYKQRASEGGLLITEGTHIDRLAGGYPQAPGIYNKEQVKAWKKITDAVHEKKGFMYCQLWHTGRATNKLFNPNQEQIVSASDIAITGKDVTGQDYEAPRPLTIEEIKEVVQQYARAARYAIEAGFDGVEVHGANGYLVDQFINSSSNKRTDIYGGSIENRTRFALEVVDAITQAIGVERTAIRLSPGTTFQDMYDDTEVETFSYLTKKLQEKYPKMSYLHFIEARGDAQTSGKVEAIPDTLAPYRNIWKGPFITSGGFSNAIDFAIEFAEKTGNLISFGRAFLANPDLPERIRNGQPLNHYDRSTFYTHDATGYTDYPFFNDTKE